MFAKKRWFVLGVLLVGVAVGLVLHQASHGTALAQGKSGMSASPHYTVIETEGHNLIVTDNQKDTLYFYTADKGQPVGSPLHLRASLDLSQVGSPTLTPRNSAKFQGGAK
jgi:hypothetical protein